MNSFFVYGVCRCDMTRQCIIYTTARILVAVVGIQSITINAEHFTGQIVCMEINSHGVPDWNYVFVILTKQHAANHVQTEH